MAENSWTDRIAAERMRVDQHFEDRVTGSSFSRQQWGLVMTAVEFEIENPEDPEQARLIADTSKLSSVMSQVEEVGNRGGGMGGAPSSGGSSGGGGILSSVTSALGLGGGGGGGNDALTQEATELAEEYASKLQERLEDRGRWEAICEQASSA